MNSSLYECRVMHHRFAPKAHRFEYRIFLTAIDLDELPNLQRSLHWFSVNRRNVYSFRERDFLPTETEAHNPSLPLPVPPASRGAPSDSLKGRVAEYLARHGIELGEGRVVLLTLPRVFGYLFNPVSFYFCSDRAGQPLAAIAEVTNTFKEMKPFLLGPATRVAVATKTEFQRCVPKFFYVSPFTATDVAFDFKVRVPDENLSIQIDDYTGGERTLTSLLHGPRRPLTNARLAWYTVKYPLITLRIITLIHWHALLLYLKKLPWFAKGARPETQRDLYRPHHSIAHQNEA